MAATDTVMSALEANWERVGGGLDGTNRDCVIDVRWVSFIAP